MADEKKLLPVIGLDQAGIIKDVPGHILPQPAFTDGKNVFFKNSSVQKRKGTIKAVDDVSAIVATVNSTSGNTMTFNIDPALTVDSEFTIANATPSAFNGTYNVTAVSETGKTITVSQTLTTYTSGGTYTFTPKIDFVDYWPAPNNPQYIEVQQNDAATPAAPVFNSIRASGTRERISLKTYEVEGINQSITPTITIDGDPFNLTNYDVNGNLVVKPVVEREIKAGETLKVFGSNPSGYDGDYVVTGITYNTGTTKTEISCSSASVNTLSLAAYTTDSAELRRDTFSPTSYLGITSQDWQSAFFAGGYAYIINDGYHTPHYLLASLGANYVTPQLTPLPGWDWQRYLGEEVHVSCKVIRGFKDTLIAGNLNLYPITTGVPSLNPSNSKPGTIRISRTAAPGEIPTSWQPALTEAFVEERELSTTSAIMDIVPLQGSAIVYTTDSIHSIKYDSRGNVFDEVIAEGYGALETGCVLEFDGKHIVIGSDDIYMFGGHPGSIQSICDGKMRDYFYDNLSPTPAYLDNIFMVRDTSLDEIHIYYPTKLSPNGFCDEYLAWNYRNNTWTINECDNLVSGFLGPVRGGGVAGGTVTFAGVGNTTAFARSDQQSITVDLDADYTVVGGQEVQTLDYTSNNTAVASTYQEETLSITIPSEIIPFSEEFLEFDFIDTFDSGATSRDIGTQTGSTSGVGSYDVGNTGIDLTVTNITGSGAAQLNITTAGTYSQNGRSNTVVTVNTTNGTDTQTETCSTSTQNYSYNFSGFSYSIQIRVDSVENTPAGDVVDYTILSLTSGVTVDSGDVTGQDLDGNDITFGVTINNTTYAFTGGVVDTANGWSGNAVTSDSNGVDIPATTRQQTQYALSNVTSGSDIDFVIGSQTLTETNLTHSFNDSNTSRSWSITGTVPTQTHSSTTNSDGTLATGSGTTSPTNISGFTGLDLTEAQITASATTSSGSGSYPRTITHLGSDGTVARTVIVQENPAANPATKTFPSGTLGGVAPGFSFVGPNNDNTVSIFSNGFSYKIYGVTASLASLNGPINYTYNGTLIGQGPYYGNTITLNSAGASVVFTGVPTAPSYSFTSQTNGTNWSDTAATIDSATGLVSFPTQYKTVYTLTNGSSVTIDNVDLTIGSTTVSDSSFAPNDTLSIAFGDSGSARAWTVTPGTAAEFELQQNGSIIVPFTSFPANIGAAAAVSYAANIITSASSNFRAQPKSTDNTVLQVFYNNSDFSGTSSNISIDFNTNDGSDVGTTSATRTAQGQFFTQYRVQINNNNNDEVINITPTFNSTNITLSGAQNTFASEVGEYLRDQIISAINSSTDFGQDNEPDWYDNGSSGALGSDYVIRIGTNDIENYSVTLTNINTTNVSYPGASSGTNNTFTFSDTLDADSGTTPDIIVVRDPYNNVMTTLTTRSGETIDSVMSRVAAAIQADTNDGWGAVHSAGNDEIVFTATAAGRYPSGTGAPVDLVYTNYSVISFDTLQGANVISTGNIPDINAAITTQGAKESVKLTIVDPSRDNSGLNGPYEDTFVAGGSTNEDIANAIKNRIDNFWANWTAAVTDTGVAASGTATGNQFKVTLTSVTNDWILKDRASSDITANDVVYPNDRAVYVKEVIYDSDVLASSSSSNATAGTNFDADSNQSGNFIPADVQIGHPIVSPTRITVAVEYTGSTVTQNFDMISAGNSDSMATGLASILNSSAVPALGASASGSVLTVTTNDLTQQINNITFTFDEQTTQTGRNSVSRSNGNNIAGSGAAPSTTLALNTVTDADRPYATSEFNLNKFYPIVANQTSILCEGIGYTFNADPPNSVAGTPYASYIERIQLPIDNSVEYKKNVSYVQLLVDEGDVLVKFKGSDSPGEEVVLSGLTGKLFDYDGEYKIDFRENGRVFNIRIQDATTTSTTPWRVSGYGLKTEMAESRGRT